MAVESAPREGLNGRVFTLLAIIAGLLLATAALPGRQISLGNALPPPAQVTAGPVIISENLGDDLRIPPKQSNTILEWASVAVVVTLVIVVLVSIGIVVWLLLKNRRRRLPPSETELLTPFIAPPPAVDIAAVVKARQLLAEERSVPSDRIVQAWVSLEDACQSHCGLRPAAMTPAQWGRNKLVDAGAPAGQVTTLVDLYYRARFRPHTISESADIDQAQAALAVIEKAVRV